MGFTSARLPLSELLCSQSASSSCTSRTVAATRDTQLFSSHLVIIDGYTSHRFHGYRHCPLCCADGIRHDYLERGLSLPAFQRVQLSGVTAQWMQPIFPSETFPNHYTIVTGLYAESHGIVAKSVARCYSCPWSLRNTFACVFAVACTMTCSMLRLL